VSLLSEQEPKIKAEIKNIFLIVNILHQRTIDPTDYIARFQDHLHRDIARSKIRIPVRCPEAILLRYSKYRRNI
jgi:hypothetical protein